MGYWVDMDNPYVTYENKYIESVWWLIGELHRKIYYKGYTVQPFSPAAGTGLSSHELNQPGTYKEVKDTTVVAQFKLTDASKFNVDSAYFLAWTTTPWTLPSNTALAVGKNIDYLLVKTSINIQEKLCKCNSSKNLLDNTILENERKSSYLSKRSLLLEGIFLLPKANKIIPFFD